MKTLIYTLMITFSFGALAEFEKHEPARINFNQMIEANHQENIRLQKALNDKGFGKRPETEKKTKKHVTDFLDAELGWGEAPQIVDRRFNSVDEPKVRLIPAS